MNSQLVSEGETANIHIPSVEGSYMFLYWYDNWNLIFHQGTSQGVSGMAYEQLAQYKKWYGWLILTVSLKNIGVENNFPFVY